MILLLSLYLSSFFHSLLFSEWFQNVLYNVVTAGSSLCCSTSLIAGFFLPILLPTKNFRATTSQSCYCHMVRKPCDIMKPFLLGCVRGDVWRTSSLTNSTKGPFSSQNSTLGASLTIIWSIKTKVETIKFHWWLTQVFRAQSQQKEVQKSWIVS